MKDCKVLVLKQQYDEKILRFLSAQLPSNCQSKINRAWGRKNLKDYDFIIVAMREGSKTRRKTNSVLICGFVFIKELRDNLYINLICSNMGYGSILLAKTEALAIKRKKDLVVLKALPEVIRWYEKKGFKHSKNACKKRANPRNSRRRGDYEHGFLMSKCMTKRQGALPALFNRLKAGFKKRSVRKRKRGDDGSSSSGQDAQKKAKRA